MKLTQKYDAESKTLWVESDAKGLALVDVAMMKPFVAILAAGRTTEGEVKQVSFVFTDKDAAEYNRDSLAFSRLNTYLRTGKKLIGLNDDAPSFDTREDFGI